MKIENFNDLFKRLLVVEPKKRISFGKYFDHKFWLNKKEIRSISADYVVESVEGILNIVNEKFDYLNIEYLVINRKKKKFCQ